jgi:hypothetical protein
MRTEKRWSCFRKMKGSQNPIQASKTRKVTTLSLRQSTQFSPRTKWSHLLHAKMSQIGTCLYARLYFHILSFSISKVYQTFRWEKKRAAFRNGQVAPHESFMEIDELTQGKGTNSKCAHLIRGLNCACTIVHRGVIGSPECHGTLSVQPSTFLSYRRSMLKQIAGFGCFRL